MTEGMERERERKRERERERERRMITDGIKEKERVFGWIYNVFGSMNSLLGGYITFLDV